MKALDTPYSLINHCHEIKAAGFGAAIRYISPNSRTFPNKCLQRSEVEAAHSVGLAVGCVWEVSDSPGSITGGSGLLHASAAIAQLDAIGAPPSVAPYFAVDFDADPKSSDIVAYFEAAHTRCRAAGRLIGVYGSGAVCDMLLRAGLVHYDWLAQSRGWSRFDPTGKTEVQGASSTVAGLPVDLDSITDIKNAGLWLP